MPVSTITLPPAYSMPAPEINTPRGDNNGSDQTGHLFVAHLRPRRQTSTIRRVIPTADANAKVVIVEEAKGVKTVNLSPFFVVDESEENEKEKARVAAELAESWEASGTFLVKVSDEDKAILQNAVKVGHDFFSLPLDEKLKINQLPVPLEDLATVVRGYVPNNKESAAAISGRPKASPDQAEKFSWMNPATLDLLAYVMDHTKGDEDALKLERAILRPNRFYDTQMEKVLLEYTRLMGKLSNATMRAVSLAMNLGEYKLLDIVSPASRTPNVNSRLMEYPATSSAASSTSTARLQGHSDGSIVTLNYRPHDDPALGGGLQILQDGAWRAVPATGDDAIVVHPGDVLEWMSDGQFPGLFHRVGQMSEGAPHRNSIATFVFPSMDFDVKILNGDENNGGQTYKSMRFSKWAKDKFDAAAGGQQLDRLESFDDHLVLPNINKK
ncbi:aconitate hydratase [Pycnococcus provasolii]